MWSLGYRNQAIHRLRFLVTEGIFCKIDSWSILCNYLINTKPITIKNNKNKLYKTEQYYNNEKKDIGNYTSHTLKSVIIILVIILYNIISIKTYIVENIMKNDIGSWNSWCGH